MRAPQQHRAGPLPVAQQCGHERVGIEAAGVWRKQRGFRLHVRLAAFDEGTVDDTQARHTVGRAKRMQPFQFWFFGLEHADYQLAAAVVRDTVSGAEPV